MVTATLTGRRTGSCGAVALAALACAWLVAGVALGQTSAPAAGGLATVPYSDPTFGFEMQVPAGWVYDRGRFQGPEGAIGILRGSKDYTHAIQILIFRNFEMTGFEQWLTGFERHLEKLHGTSAQRVGSGTHAGRTSAITMIDARAGQSRARTYYLCIPFDPNTIWVLAWAGQVPDEAAERTLRAQFDQIAATVRVSYSPLEAQQLASAFDRGLAVLKELRAGAAAVQFDETERYYEISIGGRSIGYLSRRMARETRALTDQRIGNRHKEGLRVREESWRFADDGTVRCTELNMFSSFDLRSELIERRTTQVPAPDVPAQRLYIELDQCVREDQVLFSSFSTNVDRDLPDPRPPIPIGPRYLNLAWVRLLPRLLLTAAPETYAFAVYDSGTRALVVHTIRPLGSQPLPGRPAATGFAFEVREGFVGPPSRVYTDEQGHTLRIETGDLVIASTTKDQVERKYAGRRAPARRLMEGGDRPGRRP